MGFSKNPSRNPNIQDGGDPPSWILTPKCKNAIFSKTKKFRAMMSINDRKSYMGFSNNLFLDP